MRKPVIDTPVFSFKYEADDALAKLTRMIERYGSATAKDLYLQAEMDMVDQLGYSIESDLEYYGWKDLSRAKVRFTSGGGWELLLPPLTKI